MGLLDKSAIEQSKLLEAKAISAVELMQETLDHIDDVNPEVNAIVALAERDDLMAQAAQADQVPRKGWMHGLPLAVKDLANAKGFLTTMGSPIFETQMAQKDDLMVQRMRDAGAIIIGKTNTPEFGLGSHTFNPVYGATGNAYDRTKSAGGSSGGAAVALAKRMVSIADGSDMMGSLRNPAGWNNVYGFRPTWGLVPSEPVGDSFLHQLATNGPMARCPRDLAALLSTQSGKDQRQPHGLEGHDFLAEMTGSIKGKRFAWLGDWSGHLPMEDGIIDGSLAAIEQMRKLGADVDDLAAPFSGDQLWESWTTLRSWAVAGSAGALYANPDTKDLLKPAAIWEIERGLAMSALDVHRASVTRSQWFAKAADLFDTYDALILPSAQLWPFPVDWIHPKNIAGVEMDTYHRWMQVVVPAGLIGLPVVNIPAGFGQNGLPLGLQVIGRRSSDAALLSIAQDWHSATDWPNARPA